MKFQYIKLGTIKEVDNIKKVGITGNKIRLYMNNGNKKIKYLDEIKAMAIRKEE